MSQAVAEPTEHNVNFARTIRSEYIKFRTLRSTWILLLATVAVLVGIAAFQSWGMVQIQGTKNQLPPEMIHMAPSAGVGFGQLVLASLGAVFIGGEYHTGMVRSTMTAVPNRWSPLVSKALVLALAAFLVGTISGFVAFFTVQPILAAENLDFSLDAHGVLGSMFGSTLYLVCVALMGLAAGSLLRNSAASIVTVVGLLFVLPIIFSVIQLDFIDTIHPYFPDQAGTQMAAIDTSGDTLNQWQGGLVCAAWAGVPFIAGLILTKVRDV